MKTNYRLIVPLFTSCAFKSEIYLDHHATINDYHVNHEILLGYFD